MAVPPAQARQQMPASLKAVPITRKLPADLFVALRNEASSASVSEHTMTRAAGICQGKPASPKLAPAAQRTSTKGDMGHVITAG